MSGNSLDGEWVRRFVTLADEAVVARREELTELDRQIGDGDHGENMQRGLNASAAAVQSSEASTLAELLDVLATSLMSTVGGAAGPLYGTAVLRAASVAAEADDDAASPSEVGVPGSEGRLVHAMLDAALGGIVARGKAEVGDKTMVDAWAPAVEAARKVAEADGDAAAVLRAAAEAASEGAAATEPLVARKGRASYLGERAVGHRDPGAQSSALILEAAARAAEA